jgi:hypothetical protein
MAGPTEFYCGWNEPSHASQFKWLEYTFKETCVKCDYCFGSVFSDSGSRYFAESGSRYFAGADPGILLNPDLDPGCC